MSLTNPWSSGRWEVDELARQLGNLDVTSVSLALMYWHMAGVIEPVERNVFELRESLGETNPSGPMRKFATSCRGSKLTSSCRGRLRD